MNQNELTPRQQRIANLVSEGKNRNQIAQELCVSIHTINADCKSITEKFGYRSAEYWKLRNELKVTAEWRDSQVGEPFGWVNSQGQFMTHQEKQDAPIEFVEREGFDTPVYVALAAKGGV